MKIILPESDVKLLEECEVETFRASGSGGQHVNRTDSAVRLRHLPTGIVVTAQQERSQYQNKQLCLKKLRKKVELLNYRPPKRIATKISRSMRKKNLEKKKRASLKKQRRSKTSFFDRDNNPV